VRPADAPAEQRGQRRQQAQRLRRGRLGQQLEGQHDQPIAGQHRQPLAIGRMHRRHAAARGRVVEARQIVMHQRGAMQQLDGRGRGVGHGRVRIAAGPRDRQAQLRTDARTAGEDRVPHRSGQQRRPLWRRAQRQGLLQRQFDALRGRELGDGAAM
jgi:hypothetical protein